MNLEDNGPGSLRDAIVNTPAGGRVDFEPGLAGTITLTSGSLSIDHDLTINGPGADQLTISGNHLFRVLNVFAGSQVTISDLAFENGFADHGSGLFNDGHLDLARVVVSQNNLDYGDDARGAGILNSGDLTMSDCTVAQNDNQMFPPAALGVGIYNSGSLGAVRTTITQNRTGDFGGYGGGIYNLGLVALTDSTVNGSAAYGGGGIDSESGFVSITDSTVTGFATSSYKGQGGGIRNSGVLTVTGSIIHGGIFGSSLGDFFGGGIYNTGTLNLTGSSVTGSGAGLYGTGGGIYNTGTAVLDTCSISQNRAENGGGIYTYGGSMTLTDCTVANNKAQKVSEDPNSHPHGGGIEGIVTAMRTAIYGNLSERYGGGVAGGGTFIDCTISGNTAYFDGGGVDGGGTFINSTITDNEAYGSPAYGGNGGGGLATEAAILRNTVVARNKAPYGSGPDIFGTVAAATYDLIGDGSGSSGVIDGVDGNQVGTGSLPIDPRLGQLQDNGGPTWTEALLAGSPAIDAGNNADAPETDQRGFNRIVGGTVDIGAYEYQPPATLTLLQCDHNPSTVGQAVTFTVEVAGSTSDSNIPTGLVTFFDNGNVLGTLPLEDGTAALTTSDLTVGNHTILAVYTGFSQGDFSFDASLSDPLNQEVLSTAGPFTLQATGAPAFGTTSVVLSSADGISLTARWNTPDGEIAVHPGQARNAAAGHQADSGTPDLFLTEVANAGTTFVLQDPPFAGT
jgi:hypothetical protein